jgi:hypothetical protein
VTAGEGHQRSRVIQSSGRWSAVRVTAADHTRLVFQGSIGKHLRGRAGAAR